jgi:hypothetical protein
LSLNVERTCTAARMWLKAVGSNDFRESDDEKGHSGGAELQRGKVAEGDGAAVVANRGKSKA